METQELREEAKRKIDEVFNDYEMMERKLNNASDEIKERNKERMKKLEDSKLELTQRFNEMKNGSENRVREMKPAFDNSMQSFKRGFTELSSVFK